VCQRLIPIQQNHTLWYSGGLLRMNLIGVPLSVDVQHYQENIENGLNPSHDEIELLKDLLLDFYSKDMTDAAREVLFFF